MSFDEEHLDNHHECRAEAANMERQRDEEKARRVYYQDIVYHVCNVLDRIFAKRPGRLIVCGTAENPSVQVQEYMNAVEDRCKEWEKLVRGVILEVNQWRQQ